MAVYVDRLFEATPRTAQARRHGTTWCHMTADTDAELHAMARTIGLRTDWAQDLDHPDQWRHHYDLVPGKRALAVLHGAVEVDDPAQKHCPACDRTLPLRMFRVVHGWGRSRRCDECWPTGPDGRRRDAYERKIASVRETGMQRCRQCWATKPIADFTTPAGLIRKVCLGCYDERRRRWSEDRPINATTADRRRSELRQMGFDLPE